MKIKANNANSPVWKDVHSHTVLPEKLEPLREIAYNLWWVWNYEATRLFNKIDSDLWKKTEGNPVLFLQSISYRRMEEIMADQEFLDELKKVHDLLKTYLSEKPNPINPSVAYFSMEFMLSEALPIYSGGLGNVAGDQLKIASDLGVVELYADGIIGSTPIKQKMHCEGLAVNQTGNYIYSTTVSASRSKDDYTVRIIPCYDSAIVPLEMNAILWQR